MKELLTVQANAQKLLDREEQEKKQIAERRAADPVTGVPRERADRR